MICYYSKPYQTKWKKEGIEHFGARSVDEALNILKQNKIDGVWLDHYLLGDKTGIDFMEQLSQSKFSSENIPVFVVSNTATSEKIDEYKKMGVVKFFTKANHKLTDIISEIQKNLIKIT